MIPNDRQMALVGRQPKDAGGDARRLGTARSAVLCQRRQTLMKNYIPTRWRQTPLMSILDQNRLTPRRRLLSRCDSTPNLAMARSYGQQAHRDGDLIPIGLVPYP